MTKTILLDKYPVFSLELSKDEVNVKNVDEIVSYFKNKIDAHPIAKFIAIFDHYAHTQEINGDINPDIKDAQNITFCFGKAIPNTKIVAVRPRSIGVCELQNSFVIDFIEAPNEELHNVMENWAKGLKVN
ncbi:MAG: hypothetical protein U9Q33_09845 [Campylobacterota bacterium]|nr:hypothetical protein [Campylobacterota bacterium]